MYKNLASGIKALFISQALYLSSIAALVVAAGLGVSYDGAPASGLFSMANPGLRSIRLVIAGAGLAAVAAAYLFSFIGLFKCSMDDSRFRKYLFIALAGTVAGCSSGISGPAGTAAQLVCSAAELIVGIGSIRLICEDLKMAGHWGLAKDGGTLIKVYTLLFAGEISVIILGLFGIQKGQMIGFIGLAILALAIFYFFGYITFLLGTLKAFRMQPQLVEKTESL